MVTIDDSKVPNFIVIGAGGVGVITALSLCIRSKSNVSLVVRSDYDHVREFGYQIESCDYGSFTNWRPDHLYRKVEDASKSGTFFDYVVVTTKNIPDGPVSSRVPVIIKPVMESNHYLNAKRPTNVCLIQNGIDIENDILEAFDKNLYNLSLLSGIQLIGSTKTGEGIISQVGQDHLSVGAFDHDDSHAVAAAHAFVDMYNNSGHNIVNYDPNVRYSRWRKLLYNAAINTTTALVGLDVPRCLEFAKDKKSTEEQIFLPAMKEIIALAKSENIELEEEYAHHFVNFSRDIMFKPSMCIDCEKGQLMELEVILGNPLKIAERNGVSTPVLSILYNLLFLTQSSLKEKNGLLNFDESKARIV